ncbi:hypothetical protein M5689_021411 [Euphorbia peplus]|nr:hypothetical protein M5689_021411 [Euphorbia peplus]
MSFNTQVVSNNMETQRSDESLFSLHKLEKILPPREIQNALVKLWSYYSQKNHSAKDVKSSNASSSEHEVVHQVTLLNKISHYNCLSGGNKSYKREMERILNSKRFLTGLRSGEGSESLLANSSGADKQVLVVDTEIEQMSRRLEFLEKETKIMKQELFEELEEMENLMNEISLHFQIIYSHLQLEDPVFGERAFDESLSVNTSMR